VTPSACTSSYCGIPSDSHIPIRGRRLGRYSSLIITPLLTDRNINLQVGTCLFFLFSTLSQHPIPNQNHHSCATVSFSRSFCTFLCPRFLIPLTHYLSLFPPSHGTEDIPRNINNGNYQLFSLCRLTQHGTALDAMSIGKGKVK